MYITSIQLQRSLPPYMIHGIVQHSTNNGKHNLWRIDGQTMLLASEVKPDIKILTQLADEKNIRTSDYEPFLSTIQNGTVRRFTVKFTPVLRHNGKTSGIVDAEEWLTGKEERLGVHFLAQSMFTLDKTPIRFVKKDEKQNMSVVIPSSTVTGMLVVTDSEKLKTALKYGIGHGKGFGCGLLTVSAPCATTIANAEALANQ